MYPGQPSLVNGRSSRGYLLQNRRQRLQALRLALHHGVNPKDIGLWSLFRASGFDKYICQQPE